MAIFAISDLHLSFGCDKPMNVFSNKWDNYTDKMQKVWNTIVSDDDLVIIPGDISWATYIDDATDDFAYIHSLKGKKLLLKGNHDYWWTTISKMDAFLEKNGFDSISILKNTAFMYGDTAICGTRGWTIPSADTPPDNENVKIYERERQRLILSLEDAKSKRAKKIICAMHYPPIENDCIRKGFTDILNEYNVSECLYGHLHAAAHKSALIGVHGGINLRLVSCDYLDFIPLLIEK